MGVYPSVSFPTAQGTANTRDTANYRLAYSFANNTNRVCGIPDDTGLGEDLCANRPASDCSIDFETFGDGTQFDVILTFFSNGEACQQTQTSNGANAITWQLSLSFLQEGGCNVDVNAVTGFSLSFDPIDGAVGVDVEVSKLEICTVPDPDL